MSAANDRWWSSWREVGGATILHVHLTPDADHEARAFDLLHDDEKRRCRRFWVETARRRFALCRAALRINLTERLGCSNRQLSFGYLDHGKPFAKVNGRRAPAGFNVSHSGSHGLIALAEHHSLGVDVEERLPRRDLDGIADSVYGSTERCALATAKGQRKLHLFYRLWSLKEALIKALGSGFSLDPAGFEVPEPMLHGARSGTFRFPRTPSTTWRLLDLGEPRFAAALACRLPAPLAAERTSPHLPLK